MTRVILALTGASAALLVAGCAVYGPDYGPGGAYYADGPAGLYYDDFYGPTVYDGYWDGEVFVFRDDADHEFRRDTDRHFRRAATSGYHTFKPAHGVMTRAPERAAEPQPH